jgi:DNA helicase-2/ATP-dependent DNA helicase PcrA
MDQAYEALAVFLRDNLNAPQREAVEQETGSLLVIAGAGSGKTRVITARIANLIVNKGVLPSSIIALTFTNKAAKEMLERVAHFVPDKHNLPFIGTFHAYCLRVLKRYKHLLPTPFESILDEEDQQKILSTIIQRFDLSKRVHVKQLAYQISQLKNRTINPTESAASLLQDQMIVSIYHAYEAEKRANHCLDFDDLLLETLSLLKKNEPVLTLWRESIKHLLVDEYQDTNIVQHALLKQMTLDKKTLVADSVCVVGDEDQSIYSWRGATVENIVHFTKDFANTRIIKIEQNYRSVQPILAVANAVVSHNKQRNPKELWSERAGKDRIRGITCVSDRKEGDTIALCMETARKSEQIASSAILYRAHFQSRSLEEALIKRSIPYRIIGGIQFYERKEIKDLLAYLKIIVNPHDRISFFRIINCPTRGLGEQFETIFRDRWHDEPLVPFSEIATHLIQQKVIIGVRRTAVEHFMTIIAPFKSNDKPSQVTEHIIIKTGYLSYLTNTYDKEEAVERHENIKELLRAMHQFELQGIDTLSAFLDEVALMQELASRDKSDNNPVLLMTMHAAKGLEFDLVAIAGLEEGILPSSRSLVSSESIEEERRLCYVAITRAKSYLLLTHCRSRYAYGQTNDQLRSRFIDEMPSSLISMHDGSYLSDYQLTVFFSGWFGTRTNHTQTFGIKTQEVPQTKRAIISKKVGSNSTKTGILNTQKIVPATTCLFKKYQTVKHSTFGTGIVQSIDDRGNGIIFVEVRFANNTKKIAASFLTTV